MIRYIYQFLQGSVTWRFFTRDDIVSPSVTMLIECDYLPASWVWYIKNLLCDLTGSHWLGMHGVV